MEREGGCDKAIVGDRVVSQSHPLGSGPAIPCHVWSRELVLQSQALYNSCIAGAISEETYVEGLRYAGLVEVEVRERLIYDAAQLQAFMNSELEDRTETLLFCGDEGPGVEAMSEITTAMVGKVWSVKVGATKP